MGSGLLQKRVPAPPQPYPKLSTLPFFRRFRQSTDVVNPVRPSRVVNIEHRLQHLTAIVDDNYDNFTNYRY